VANSQIRLAYTLKAGIASGDNPAVFIGIGSNKLVLTPNTAVDNSYWWFFLDNSSLKEVYSVVVPGANNTTVPPNITTYITNPNILFGVATQYLGSNHLPQGALYDFFANYDSGDALKELEQANASMGCGYLGQISYALLGQGGPGGPTQPPSYEAGSFNSPSFVEITLGSQLSGQPPYYLIDEYTFQ